MSRICKDIETACKIKDTRRKKVLKDPLGGSARYTLNNKEGVEFSMIDFQNFVYNDSQEKRCDYGISCKNSINYVELKGSDIIKGIKQITTTINATSLCFSEFRIKARIIANKTPKPGIYTNTSEYKKLKTLTTAFVDGKKRSDFLIRQSHFVEAII